MHNDPQKWHTDQVDTVRTFVAAVHVQMRDSHRPSAACPPEHDGSSVAHHAILTITNDGRIRSPCRSGIVWKVP